MELYNDTCSDHRKTWVKYQSILVRVYTRATLECSEHFHEQNNRHFVEFWLSFRDLDGDIPTLIYISRDHFQMRQELL